MMTIRIVAAEKKGYVSINGATEVVCPLVKDREDKYSLNIKKLGYARSFISVGDLTDKELNIDEASLSQTRTIAKRGPKTVTVDHNGYLSDDEAALLTDLLTKINEGYARDFDAAQAAKNAPKTKVELTEDQKIEQKIARLMAKIKKLEESKVAQTSIDDIPTDDGDEVVED